MHPVCSVTATVLNGFFPYLAQMIPRLNGCVLFNNSSSLDLIKHYEDVFNFLDTVHFNVFKQTKHYASYAQSHLSFLPVSTQLSKVLDITLHTYGSYSTWWDMATVFICPIKWIILWYVMVRPSIRLSFNIWLSTTVTTCHINFMFHRYYSFRMPYSW